MPTVEVPPPYRGPTGGVGEVAVEGASARACLLAVDEIHPGFAELIFDAEGGLHRFVRLFVDEDPLDEDALDKPLPADSVLSVVAAIGGGRGSIRLIS